MKRYWIAVASNDHVQRGVDGGFCQVCHGKPGPLKRMKSGDRIIYYSPQKFFQGKEPLKAFTAVGTIKDDHVYQFEMAPDFVPYRRDVTFDKVHQFVPIKEILDELTFIEDKQKYGYKFRFGLFEIPEEDYLLVQKMLTKH